MTIAKSLLWLLVSLSMFCTVIGQQVWTQWDDRDEVDPWRDKPWGKPGEFDNDVVVETYYGYVRG